MKITRINKEYGYTVGYSCSVCGNVIVPEFFCKYGDTIYIDHAEFGFCSCGARLLDEWVYESIDE